MLLRRAAIDRVGAFDQDYFIYSEEVDLCHRLRRSGWTVYWVPAAVAIHYGGQSTRQRAASMFLQLYKGKVLYFRKQHGPLVARAYKLILLVSALARLVVSPLVWLERGDTRRRHLLLLGYYTRLVGALPRL
jgi:GT2 family glycosyltransferase